MKIGVANLPCVQKKARPRSVVAVFLILATFASGQDSSLTVEDLLERISENTEQTSYHTSRTAAGVNSYGQGIVDNTRAINQQLYRVNGSLTNYMSSVIPEVRDVMSDQQSLESAYDATTNADLTASLPTVDIPDFSETDVDSPEISVDSPAGGFNSTMRVISSGDMGAIWRDLGVSWTGGHLELDFSLDPSGSLIQRSKSMLSVLWKLSARLLELWIVFVWWRRIRDLVLHQIGMPVVSTEMEASR